MTFRALCLLALLPAAPVFAASPVLTFDSASLTAGGVTASGGVVFIAVTRVPKVYYQEIATFREVVTADASGSAVLPLDAPAPRRSVWVVVDLASGAFAVGTPEDFTLTEEALAASGIGLDLEGKPSRLELSHQAAEVLLVRPASGAWGATVVDGGALDQKPEVDGALEVGLGALTPLTQAPPPSELLAGDVLVVLDPNTLTHLAATVTAELLSQAEGE
jgi:hypothetical protein